MNIKEILLHDGTVSFPYKDNPNNWVGTANIHSFGDKIMVEVPTAEIKGRKEFDIKNIDEAIRLFERLIFSDKNLCYKK